MSTSSLNILTLISVASSTLSLTAIALARAECEGPQWREGLALAQGFDSEPLAAASVDHDGDGVPSLFVAGAGGASGIAYQGLARFVNDRWEQFGPSFSGSVASIVRFDLDGDGVPSLLVLGSLRLEPVESGSIAYSMLEWNGADWTPRGPMVGIREALVMDDDGDGAVSLFAATRFPSTSGFPAVMRWSAGNWVDASAGATLSVNSLQSEGAVLAAHDSDGDGRRELYATVSVNVAGASVATNIARWNGSAWSATSLSPIPTVFAGRVYAMCEADVDGDGTLEMIAGGWLPSATPIGSAPQVVALDGGTWSGVGGAFLYGSTNPVNAAIYRIAAASVGSNSTPTLFATGRFTQASGQAIENIAQWNGQSWVAVGAGLPGAHLGANRALIGFDVDADGSRELIGFGNFVESPYGILNRAASWNGATWEALGAPAATLGLNGDATYSVLFDHDGDGRESLVVGGRFSSAGGTQATNLAAFDGTSWSPIANPWSRGVGSLLVADLDGDGQSELYAVGVVPSYEVSIAVYVPSKSNGASDGSWAGCWVPLGTPFGGAVTQLLVMDHDQDGVNSLLACGELYLASGVNAVIRWDGSVWNAVLTAAPAQYVNAMVAYDDDLDGVKSLVVALGNNSPTTVFQRILKLQNSVWMGVGSLTTGHTFGLQSIDHDGDGQASLLALGHYLATPTTLGVAKLFEQGVWSNFGPTSADFSRPYAGAVMARFDGDADRVESLFLTCSDPFYGRNGAVFELEHGAWSMLARELGGGPKQMQVADLEGRGRASLHITGAMTARIGTVGTGIAIIDTCTLDCAADIDGDEAVDASDLSQLLVSWGSCVKGACAADLDGSGDVGAADLSLLLASWGSCP